MRGEATVVAILFAAFMSLLTPLMLLNPAGMLTAPSYPEILDARVAPEKIPPGDPLYITAWIRDPRGIETIHVYIENEAGVDRVEMTLASGSLFDGMFEAKWISHDTLDKKWYNATIIATNTMNLSSYVILAWQDPTQGHAASQVRAGTFSSGNYAFPNNLSVGGTNLFVDNSTGMVGINTTGPGFVLDVGGRSRIRGSGGLGGGLWLTKSGTPTTNTSFIGRASQGEGDDWTGVWTNGSWRFIIEDTGNVGIGTIDPGAELDVNGTLNTVDSNIGTGEVSDLLIDTNHTSYPYSEVNVSWTMAVLADSSGNVKRFDGGIDVANITDSGANGLDTGSEASSTWYYIWLIGKTDGTVDGLLSASSTSPTMPSGYDYKLRLGSVYNNGSSDFRAFIKRGDWVSQKTVNVVTDGTATTVTSVDISSAAPPTIEGVSFNIFGYFAGTTEAYVYMDAAGDILSCKIGGRQISAIGNYDGSAGFGVPVDVDTIYYQTSGATVETLDITGYYEPV